MTTLVLRIGIVCLLLPLSACMNMSGLGGDSKYACQAPDGVACDSVSGTYANALHNNLPSQRAQRSAAARRDESEEMPTTATVRAAPSTTVGDSGTTATLNPLRSQARVLRLWIKPWQDADGDLYDQGYVYVRIDNGQWLIDHVQQQIRDAYAPLKPPPTSTTDAAGSHPAGNTPATPMLPQRPLFKGADAGDTQ